MERGAFITFEGGEGAGKTLQVARLANRLAARGDEVIRTREPGGGEGGEAIRALLLDPEKEWLPLAQTFLNCAGRVEHVHGTIRPARERGAWVLCDRFMDSTWAYQGYGEGVDLRFLDSLASRTMNGCTPDLTLVLDVPPETGLTRAHGRGTTTPYETRGRAYHTRVRQGFLDIAAAEPDRCVVIDATADAETVHGLVLAAVRARLGFEPDSLRS